MAGREVGADVLRTEEHQRRRLLDRTFQELTKWCMLPCDNFDGCDERAKFEGLTDNARIPCQMRIYFKDKDYTDTKHKIPDKIYEGCEGDFGNKQQQQWAERTPRQLFLYNQRLIQQKVKGILEIRCYCASEGCGSLLETVKALDTVEKLYLDLRVLLAHSRDLPLLYDPLTPSKNADLPDDARTVCELSHKPQVDKFAEEILPKHIDSIKASLEHGALKARLQEKRKTAFEKFGDGSKTYIRIGLGIQELGKLTAILELWPKGYSSPKHHHGGCAGSIRVLHGELSCKLYKTLLEPEPMEFQNGDCGLKLLLGKHKTLVLKKPQTTWLNRQNWWVHEVECGSGDFALTVHLYKSCTDEFAFVKQEKGEECLEKSKDGLKNDFFWNLSAERIGLPESDDRIKEIGQESRAKDFVKMVLEAKAPETNGPSAGPMEAAPRQAGGYPASPSEVAAWEELKAENPPPVRQYHTAIYDKKTSSMLVFGGYNGNWLNDLWKLDLKVDETTGKIQVAVWEELKVKNPLQVRAGHTAIYHEKTSSMLVFGGYDRGNWLNDLWKLDLKVDETTGKIKVAGWEQLKVQNPPPVRSLHTAVYDEKTSSMLVFGGLESYDGGSLLNDLWKLDLKVDEATGKIQEAVWEELKVKNPPPVRWGHTAVYHEKTSSMLVFGGRNVYGYGNWFNDLWKLDLKDRLQSNLLVPCPRIWSHRLQVDETTGKIQVAVWEELKVKNPPPVRYYHTAVYDEKTSSMLVFGGYNGKNDLWKLDLKVDETTGKIQEAVWEELKVKNPPPVRFGHTAVYDEKTSSMLVFGGCQSSSNGQSLNDLWKLN